MPQVYMNIPHSTRSNSNVLIPSMNAAGTAGPADTTTLGAAEAGVVAASAAAAAAPQQRSNEDAPMTEEAQRIFQQVQNAFNQPLSSYPDNSAQLGDDPFSDGLDPQHNDELNPNWRQQVANDRMLQHLANHGAMSLVQPDFTAEPSRATASLRSSTPMQGQPPTSPSPGPSSS
ncbi:hypothetical protein EV182_005296 [Spiromyces aspiralis]|uniref:Uncharacterized protein n=1 Tax=Spiromyces aspiralis TaxID=68401 RepID=A0ACC1HRW2_9FUNG|nr:hypothetical protein EV182_005296 [Spiromyces aspiralis]